jgi:predicted alpha/beta hydrolase family esterase
MPRHLIIPGWANSGPTHWQTHWQRALPDATRVEMPDWLSPRRADWVAALDAAIRAAPEPPILIAHSLGCHAVVSWAATSSRRIAGALLVAPPDLERRSCPPSLRDFAPVPRAPLRFPSRVVASDNDPYAALPASIQLAFAWSSAITVLEAAGHINADAGFGPWPDGLALLDDLVAEPAPLLARSR